MMIQISQVVNARNASVNYVPHCHCGVFAALLPDPPQFVLTIGILLKGLMLEIHPVSAINLCFGVVISPSHV